MEVNIYHGKFGSKGIVALSHYHNDLTSSNLHKHFHYHLSGDDGQNQPHQSE